MSNTGGVVNNIWKNKYLTIEMKARIYKNIIRAIVTYAVEARVDTSKIQQLLETAGIQKITNKTLIDRTRNEEVRMGSRIGNKPVEQKHDNRIESTTKNNIK